ncbi:MAG: thioredoxin family protein [Phycisphaeraceae bacterium]
MFKTRMYAITISVLTLITLTCYAAERTDPVIGEPAPPFTLTDVVTGQEVSLADFKGKVVVIAFQSINCPWDRMRPEGGYQRYLAPLSQQYAEQGVQFLAINSNKNESVEEIASYHQEHAIPYPILKDPNNIVADAYNAKTTPHIYVIDKDEAQTLRYMGGVEQIPTSPEKCGQMEENYLVPVLNAVLAGEEPPYTKTTSKGCSIKRVQH